MRKLIIEYTILNNGIKMAMEGFGVFQVPDPRECEQSVLDAISTGDHLIDTADSYGNERSVGAAVRESGIPREEIWVTSKLWPIEYGEGKTMAGIDKMLERLNIGYIDLLPCYM